jgi:SAM-dependent methyltransferase
LIFTYDALLRRVATLVLPLLYRGNALTCPCCERSFRKFIRRYQEDTLCPGCLSLRRHRLLLLYLLAETRITSRGLAVLHLAPEEGLQARLSAIAGPSYVSMDAHSASIAMVTGDITAIPFDAESFDLVICSHVLEHVMDDRKAMRELFRVLRPGGKALLLQPVHDELPMTIEDPTVTSPRERLQVFGQRDHVRIYGRDFVPRLEEAGFAVTTVDYVTQLDPDVIARYSLGHELIYVAGKP